MSCPSEISWISIQYNFYLWPHHFPGKLNQLSTDWVNCSFPMTLTTFSLLTRISLPAGPLCQACLHRCLYYNLGRNKKEQLIPFPPKAIMGALKGQKHAILASLKWGGGVVEMFHLLCPHLTLDEIALQCWISKTSVQRTASTKDKVPENRSLFCSRKKKLTLEQEALILRSILELRKEEGSFSSQCLMECTGIRHVTVRTIRHLLNRNSYFFLQACKKGLMSQPDKDQRVEFAQKMQAEYSTSVWTDCRFLFEWCFICVQD